MGYGNPDLDEISTHDLVNELMRRVNCAEDAKCPYCDQPAESHTCRFVGKVDKHYGGDSGPISIRFPIEKKHKVYCSCDLRDRQWDPNTHKCLTCGLGYQEKK